MDVVGFQIESMTLLYSTRRLAGPALALVVPDEWVPLQSVFFSLSLPSRTQHMVTLQLIAAFQLPMSSLDI